MKRGVAELHRPLPHNQRTNTTEDMMTEPVYSRTSTAGDELSSNESVPPPAKRPHPTSQAKRINPSISSGCSPIPAKHPHHITSNGEGGQQPAHSSYSSVDSGSVATSRNFTGNVNTGVRTDEEIVPTSLTIGGHTLIHCSYPSPQQTGTLAGTAVPRQRVGIYDNDNNSGRSVAKVDRRRVENVDDHNRAMCEGRGWNDEQNEERTKRKKKIRKYSARTLDERVLPAIVAGIRDVLRSTGHFDDVTESEDGSSSSISYSSSSISYSSSSISYSSGSSSSTNQNLDTVSEGVELIQRSSQYAGGEEEGETIDVEGDEDVDGVVVEEHDGGEEDTTSPPSPTSTSSTSTSTSTSTTTSPRQELSNEYMGYSMLQHYDSDVQPYLPISSGRGVVCSPDREQCSPDRDCYASDREQEIIDIESDGDTTEISVENENANNATFHRQMEVPPDTVGSEVERKSRESEVAGGSLKLSIFDSGLNDFRELSRSDVEHVTFSQIMQIWNSISQ